MTGEWFRSRAWDESAWADFEVRLSRARPHNRQQQYLRIKALALRDHGQIEASKGLFRRVIAVRDGWMHSGDAGYMDEHGYVLVDRIKDMIISGAENVYSADIENVLALHPAVTSCAVIGVADDQWGERVSALVVLVPATGATFDELQQLCRRHLAGYKVPRSVEFVSILPTSGGGKVVKLALRTGRQSR